MLEREIERRSSSPPAVISPQQGFLPPPTYFPPPGGDSGEDDEELSVLPRHTKVVVRGNNRTKSVLVGLQGVVKKAVGLGGWHWLVLTNGVEVKLQRNALTVIEPPTGQEEDDEIEIPFSNDTAIDDFPRTFKPRVKQKPAKGSSTPTSAITTTPVSTAAPAALEIPNNNINNNTQDHSAPRQQQPPQQHQISAEINNNSSKKGDSMPSPEASFPVVDLSKLETAALRRYRKHFKLSDVGRNSSKEQLLRAIEKHFVSHQLDELEVITGFLQAAKRLKT